MKPNAQKIPTTFQTLDDEHEAKRLDAASIAIANNRGHLRAAARALGIGLSTLQKFCEKHGLLKRAEAMRSKNGYAGTGIPKADKRPED